jgi:hypothetical protein
MMVSGSVVTQFSLTIPCFNYYSIFAIDFKRQPRIIFCCRFHTSAVTQISMAIARSTVSQFSLMISGSVVTQFLLRFHSSMMTLSFAIDLCVNGELVFVVDSICHQLHNFQ